MLHVTQALHSAETSLLLSRISKPLKSAPFSLPPSGSGRPRKNQPPSFRSLPCSLRLFFLRRGHNFLYDPWFLVGSQLIAV